ncbi:hypothetical protein MNBD_UNCLBAC01-903 [hydrothermal vent metagenome]|uniref:DUF547 domain-containing protein n=1 Tax=hydrothermal vent metagenome TaxID=652676 RepID=A0A3B1DKR3_9ZZZZ
MNKKLLLLLFIGFFALLIWGTEKPVAAQETPKKESNQEKIIDYTLWENVLSTYVDKHGQVNYKTLKSNRTELDQFIKYIEKVDIKKLSTKNEIKAFWINAYNAITIQVAIDNYPFKSFRMLNFGLVWKLPRNIAQTKHSLEHIEHKIIRKMRDPRIHFALNCASIGCPRLPMEPFYPDKLEEQLDYETWRFINDPERIRLDQSTQTLYYSELLDWYEKDFLAVSKDITTYIKRYLNKDDQKYLENNNVKLKKIKYDWGLNEQ